jgi:predicted nucleic acid-binding protein
MTGGKSNLPASVAARLPDPPHELLLRALPLPPREVRSSGAFRSLRFGAEARRSRKLHRLVGTFVEAVAVVPIGTFDTLMAAHALSLGLTFVTNNAKHFGRVVGLETENWV